MFDLKLELFIYHYLHKNLSNYDELTDNDIKMILMKLLETLFPKAKIQHIDSHHLKILVEDQAHILNFKPWIDSIKILFNSYQEYLQKYTP